jgi:hypothetical protein
VALNVPPYEHRPGRLHIDGYAPGQPTPRTGAAPPVGLLLDSK